MNSIYRALCLVLMATATVATAQTTQSLDIPTDVGRWIKTTFGKGKLPPFSFVYDGKPSKDFLRKWQYAMRQNPSDGESTVNYTVSYTDPRTGLKVECDVKGYADFGAVEWVLHFINTSDKNSGTLSAVKTVDYTFVSSRKAPFTLNHAHGSHFEEGVHDFCPILTPLDTSTLHFTPEGGRSSDHTAFPFCNLIAPDDCGAVIAIGWTGKWFSEFSQPRADAARFTAGIERLETYLKPQESIRTPLVCMLFWKDKECIAGHNQFRRFILAHHSPRIGGKLITNLLSASFSSVPNARPCAQPCSCLTEAQGLSLIDSYRFFNLHPDIYWLDAGWALGTGYPNSYVNGAGTQDVDTIRFPNGFRPLSAAAHRQNAKLMVWFEPERVYAGSWIDRNHPEWLWKFPGNPTSLLDLGNPEACDWLCHHIGDLLEQNGIDYYRQDCNIHLSGYWAAFDEPGRVGIKEIRHVEGLYRFWDYLLSRFPNLMIDNCAGGGRRLDLETVSRSIPLWRSDFEQNAMGSQCHVYGLYLYLPQSGQGVNATDDYNLRSFMGAAMVLNWNIFNPSLAIPDMEAQIDKYRSLAPYFYEDYYPLTGIKDLTATDTWLAYQLNRSSDGTGIVVAFRRQDNPSETLDVKLQGLNPKTTYTVENDNDGTSTTLTGAQLAEGLQLRVTQTPGSVLLRYRPTTE